MDNFADDDIVLFINNFTENASQNPLRNQKIPMYVQYLRSKKHFRDNNIDEDVFFKKRFQIATEDIVEIHKLIDKIKQGKDLTRHSSRYAVSGNQDTCSRQMYSSFDESEDYQNNGFELMNEVQGAMDSYYKKMKKTKNSRNWKTRADELNRVGSVQDVPTFASQNSTISRGKINLASMNHASQSESCETGVGRYYYEGENSERPNIGYDVQGFNKSELMNMGTSNIIQKLDKINSVLEDNQLITNDFDTEYKRANASMCCNKKNQFHNEIDASYNGMHEAQGEDRRQDIAQTRFWQDNDIMNQKGDTRNKCIKNKNPFEHNFDYLESNYNRVPDPRLVGASSRMENRSIMKR